MRSRFSSTRRVIVGAAVTLSLLLFSCGHSALDRPDPVDGIIDLAIASMDSQMIEFPQLYDELFYAIPGDETEKLVLVEKLKQRGFAVIDYGRGNFPPLGPRIIAVTMTKDDCQCQVDKIYYDTISDSAWTASERIRCIPSLAKEDLR